MENWPFHILGTILNYQRDPFPALMVPGKRNVDKEHSLRGPFGVSMLVWGSVDEFVLLSSLFPRCSSGPGFFRVQDPIAILRKKYAPGLICCPSLDGIIIILTKKT